MKRFHQRRAAATKNVGDIFIGDVFMQNLVTDQDAQSLRVTSVTFEEGARNRWHTHTTEQVLVITDGAGIVATGDTELQVEKGDVILIEPSERHWHGAQPDTSMTHLSILIPGEMQISDEQ